MDESAEQLHNCNQNAVYNNTNGSHTCACKLGFTGNGLECEGKLCDLQTELESFLRKGWHLNASNLSVII